MAQTLLYAVGTTPLTVPEPDAGYQVTWQNVGGHQRTLDGGLRRHFQAKKGRWVLTWSHRTIGDLANLIYQLNQTTPRTWKPSDTASLYTVLVLEGWTLTPTEYGFTVNATLEEV